MYPYVMSKRSPESVNDCREVQLESYPKEAVSSLVVVSPESKCWK